MAVTPASDGNVTNFVVATSTIMSWVDTQLTPSTENVWSGPFRFSGSNISLLFDYLKTIPVTSSKPAVVTIYTGSQWGDVPRRTMTFSVLILTKKPRDRGTAQSDGVTVMEKVIKMIDAQIDVHARWRVTKDQPIDLPGTELNCHEVGFASLNH